METSRAWLEYFRSNQGEPAEIPWERARHPDACLIPSLQQFQLGEGASGAQFLDMGRRHAKQTGDRDFPEALALFIAEEQRHSAMLAHYLRTVGEPVLAKHWIHSVFRRLRKLADLECMVTVLVTAELLSVPYYSAVNRICGCPALEAICRRVLREEARHLQFQAATLRSIQRERPRWWVRLTHWAQEVFLVGTCVAVWKEHGEVFRKAGRGFFDVWKQTRLLLRQVQRAAATASVAAALRLESRSASNRCPAR